MSDRITETIYIDINKDLLLCWNLSADTVVEGGMPAVEGMLVVEDCMPVAGGTPAVEDSLVAAVVKDKEQHQEVADVSPLYTGEADQSDHCMELSSIKC